VIIFSVEASGKHRRDYTRRAHFAPLTVRQLRFEKVHNAPKSVAKLPLFSLTAKHFRNFFTLFF